MIASSVCGMAFVPSAVKQSNKLSPVAGGIGLESGYELSHIYMTIPEVS